MTLGNQMNLTSRDQAFENEIIVYVYRNMRVRPNEAEFDQDWYFVNHSITQGCFEHMFKVAEAQTITSNPPDPMFGEKSYLAKSPCLEIDQHPECQAYCEWHAKTLIQGKLSKEEILALMS